MRLLLAAFGLLAMAGPPAMAQALAVEEVAPGVFVHQGVHEEFTAANEGAIANLAFVVGQDAVAVIDSGGSLRQGRRLREAVEAHTGLPVRWVIATHAHPDHLFGHAAFAGDGVRFAGHQRLPREVASKGPLYLDNMTRLLGAASAGTELVAPDVTVPVGAPLEIDLGGRVLRLQAWPTAHTAADLTALDLESGTLFAGDLLFMERLPVVDGSLTGWLDVMAELAALPAERVVPGHGPAQAAWPEALAPQRAYLKALRDSVREAIEQGMPLGRAAEEIPLPAGQSWLLGDENHPRNVIASYTELEWE
ncbi:quinoprotein relay system zinc metallohydrolase 2 [Marinimicrococcus flavescens]|uniref:Quinoprotein relay system zinc metallohydrolase 2 n=1 Tax=Marinimicrococcus flavescens TaxID=3031815 RepID=A0AAP3UYI2_9PROT|nr:quinoprotein relay system zinc metallohydrolase 2 [Marinimicrococcus flavescens]